MENLVKTTEVKSFRIQLEKLDGGYVSDVSGKRKIYQFADEIIDVINMNSVLKNINEDVYHLNIDLVPKNRMEEYVDLLALNNEPVQEVEGDNFMSYAKAKEMGIIQSADVFDPNTHKEEEIEKVIKVTAANAYTSSRLKAIDWNCFDQQLPMTNAERAVVCGLNFNTLYAQFKKAKEGTASFRQIDTRIGFTILAKYYEANLGVRTCTKDKMEQLKSDMLKMLRDLETTALSNKYVKSSLVSKSINEMRKQLL